MRALVTGAAGFIGRHVTEELLATGHSVVGLDDLSTGDAGRLPEAPGLRMVVGSVTDAELVRDLARGADVVFHFAAAVGAFVIRDRPLQSLRSNIAGTENVVEAAHRAGARLLLASTSEIYGKNPKIGLREDDDRVLGSPLKSRWTYSEAKAIDESIVHGYAAEHGLRAVIARLFNITGPGQTGRYGMVVPRFVGQALRGDDLTVYGSGEQIRCFCHIDDAAPALLRLAECDAAQGRAVNIGSSEQVSINELAHSVIAATGSASGVRHISYSDAYGDGYEDMQRRVPDCGLAADLIGFRPRRGLSDIVAAVRDDHLGRQRASGALP